MERSVLIAQDLNVGTIAAISAAASAVLAAICVLSYLLLRLSSAHTRLIADLESRGTKTTCQDVAQRQKRLAISSKLLPSTTGWNQLDFPDNTTAKGTANSDPAEATSAFPRLPQSFHLQPVRPLGQTYHLKDGVPAAFLSSSPSPPSERVLNPCQHGQFVSTDLGVSPSVGCEWIDYETPQDALPRSTDNLCPQPLFSKSSGNSENLQVSKKRSWTVRPVQDQGTQLQLNDGVHLRPFSYGHQTPVSAPLRPVPPLPAAAKSFSNGRPKPRPSNRVAELSSRKSVSSIESVGSSLLVASPKITRSTSARLCSGANREWEKSIIRGPRPLLKTKSLHQQAPSLGKKSLLSFKSIHSCEGRYSVESMKEQIRRPSLNVLSKLPSKCTSDDTKTGSQLTPKRRPYSMVSSNGSPFCRQKPRLDGSSIQMQTPVRQLSPASTRVSTSSSSNGNPFQWDPSPLRPSPRKGQPRQNGVRISVPTSMSSQSPSPSMADIAEEKSEPTSFANVGGFGRPRSLPRPPSSSVFAPEIKGTCLIGSPAPSSMTLSLANLCNDIPGDSTQGLKAKSINGDDGCFGFPDLRPNDQMLRQSTFFFTSSTSIPDYENTVPEEFRLLARPVSSKSDSSSLESKELDEGMLGSDMERLQPGETIIEFNNKFDLDNSQLKRNVSNPISKASVQEAHEQHESSNDDPNSTDRPSPIRQSILHLRRMNSDAQHDSTKPGLFAARRYLMMDWGVEFPSPEMGRCESWISLGSVNSRVQLSNVPRSQGPKDSLSAASNLPDQSLAAIPAGRSSLNVGTHREVETGSGTHGVLPRLPCGASATAADVWEDGEVVWDGRKSSACGSPNILARTAMSTPLRVKTVPPSGEATPMSLYDENGFLTWPSDECNSNI